MAERSEFVVNFVGYTHLNSPAISYFQARGELKCKENRKRVNNVALKKLMHQNESLMYRITNLFHNFIGVSLLGEIRIMLCDHVLSFSCDAFLELWGRF